VGSTAAVPVWDDRRVRDDDVRSSCFASLDVLCAKFGEEVPYKDGLDAGFSFRGSRIPFLSHMKGIFRAAAQRGPAALSILTSYKSPYGDEETEEGILYAYRAGPIDQPDNRALRAVRELGVPVVYFVGTRPGWYRPFYPCFVIQDDPIAHPALVAKGEMIGHFEEREPSLSADPIERRYAAREMKVRVHQARFRGRVLPAYRDQCAICRLKEIRLLDAAHILADAERGEPAVSNGLSLCSIHHRAFDQELVGISPDYAVHVARGLLEDEDGPMLELLKGCEGSPIVLPDRRVNRPDRELLAARFDRFVRAA
jgi:putative restriction endonuclease